MSDVLFTAMICTYNAERFLLKAMNSIKEQTFKNYEMLVVDNGSTDGSAELIRRFQEENPQIDLKVITLEQNRGISGGRNAGIEAAKGQYICLLDSDDYWYPEKLQKVAKAIEEYPECSVFCHWEDHIKGDTKTLGKYRSVNNANAFEDLLYHGDCLSPSATTVKSDLFREVGGFDISRVRGEEDYDCWLRLAKRGGLFHTIQEPLGIFLIREDSVSAKIEIHYGAVMEMLRDHFEIYAKESGAEQAVMKMWRRVHAKYLCSCARQLDRAGERSKAIKNYRLALQSDWTYWKSYAGVLLHVLHR